jgi:hypothetical protein
LLAGRRSEAAQTSPVVVSAGAYNNGEDRGRAGPPWWRTPRVVLRPELLSLIVCCALAVRVFFSAWTAPAVKVLSGGGGDAGLLLWFLRWTPFAVARGMNPLFTDYINVPHGVNVMWNGSLLLPGLVLGPVTAAFGAIATFNVLCTLGLALSAWCAALAFGRYVNNRVATLIGGLVFGFSPYMLAQSRGHIHLTLAFFVPLLFLALDNILVGQRRSPLLAGALFGLLAAAQLLTGEEVFASTMLFCAWQVVVMMALFPRHITAKARYALIAFGATAVTFAAVAAWPLWFQISGPQHISGDIQSTSRFVTDLWNFVTPTGVQVLAPPSALRMARHFTGNFAETDGYIGIPLIVIVLFTVARWAWSSAVVRAAFLLALGPIVLTLGDRLHIAGRVTGVKLPWSWFQQLPLIESAVPNRFMLQAMLFIGLLLAVFIEKAWRWPWAGRALAALLTVAVVVTLVPRTPLSGLPVDAPAFFTGPDVRQVPRDSVVLVTPFPSPQAAQPMAWAAVADLRFKMPGGYFIGPQANGKPKYGPLPTPLYGQLAKLASGWDPPKLDLSKRISYLSDLDRWGVRTIVVGPFPRGQAKTQERLNIKLMFIQLLGRPPVEEGGVYVWWNVDPSTLLRPLEQADRAERPLLPRP